MSRAFERIPSSIHTFTGRMVDPLHLRVEDVSLLDIAHHLSNQCRFSGATKWHYSVAQHAYLASFEPNVIEAGEEYNALHHDDAEAYLQDMARPLKMDERFGQPYRGAESRVERVIGVALDVRFPMSDVVKYADTTLLVTEARDLMHGTESWSGSYKDHPPSKVTIKKWTPEKAERKFLARHHELLARKEGRS